MEETTRPDWTKTKTGRKKPKFRDNSRKAVALRQARALYASEKKNAVTVTQRREAWERYCRTRDYWTMF